MSPAATVTVNATATAAAADRAVLDAADAMFYERGIAGVAMSDIRNPASSGSAIRPVWCA